MKRRRKSSAVRIAAYGVGGTLLLFALLSLAAVGVLRWVPPPLTAMMLWQEESPAKLDYVWVGRNSIAVSAAHAVIAAEDQKFLEHHGFDFASIDEAIEDYRAGQELRGASTITQQVAKNLFLWPGRSFVRKGLEAYFTVLLELLWPKQRILETYLNIAELGPGVFGVEAAARRYFGISARDLGPSQAALLAAVLPNPRLLHADRPSLYVRSRQAEVLEQMALLQTRGYFRGLDW